MRILVALLLVTLCSLPAGADQSPPLRVGLTPVFLDDQTALVNAWRGYLESQLKRSVVFVRRASYREIVDLLQQQKLEFAWLCGYPYVENDKALELLAVPLYRGKPLYQSYVIVPARDAKTVNLGELKSRVFAYSDPNSNSGFLVVQDALRSLGEEPAYFFRKTFFTAAHSKVIQAVSVGLADGGAVDGYVYDVLAQLRPELVARTRVVSRSSYFGFPPIVARRDVGRAEFSAMQRSLLDMSREPAGKRVLAELHLDGFAKAEPRLYDEIRRMVSSQKRTAHGT